MAAARAHRVLRAIATISAPALLTAFFIAAGAPTPLGSLYETGRGFPAWVLTVAFGIYSIALLLSLLVIGGLSDYIGRRPVLVGSVLIQVIAILVFLFAPSVEGLILARVLQGVATAAASSSFSAATVELLPDHRKKIGGLIASAVPTTGLGLGTLLGGVIATVSANGIATVWTTLLVVFLIGVILTVITPETAGRRPGALRSLIPRATVPPQVRRLFAITVPSLVGAMMTIALFLGLVPIVFQSVFHIHSPLIVGLIALTSFVVASLTSITTVRIAPRTLRLVGTGIQVAAATGFVVVVSLNVFWLAWVIAVLQGAGLGAVFSGTVRGLVPEVGMHERASLFTAIWLVVYLTLGGSAIVAGILVVPAGPTATAIGFGSVQAVISAIGLAIALGARSERKRAAGLVTT